MGNGDSGRDRAARSCARSLSRSRRLVSRRTLSVRLVAAALADCGGEPGFLLRDNPGTEDLNSSSPSFSRTTASYQPVSGSQFSTSTRSPTSISAQLAGGRFGWGWLLALAGRSGAAAAGTSPPGGLALVGLSASSFSYSALLTKGTVARPAARMAPTGNCLARSVCSAVSTLSVCSFRLVAAFRARAVWSAAKVAASGRP